MPRTVAATKPREVMPDVKLTKAVFLERFYSQYADPAFKRASSELGAIAEIAWDGYINARKSPTTRKAGKGYADPGYELSVDWISAKQAIDKAQQGFEARNRKPRVLLINASPRSEHTCPGESSKSFRMTEIAEAVFKHAGIETKLLDLSRLTSEYGRNIHPCKACFSTAAPLCHWPCSCYPNYSLGQTQDWMNDIYPMWVEADAVFIVSPVNWYQVTSPLKLMMDRLVCADGGNPDPTLTEGKEARTAKAVELEGWDYPQHLAGRLFGVIVHGDVEGTENVRRSVSDWLRFMGLEAAGKKAEVDRYIGYWKPYATSHQELDADTAMQGEVKNAAQAVADAIKAKRSGSWVAAGAELKPPRQK
ncbi:MULTISPECIES: flavodoxin family protein [unclassified Devosia]|uniref:flavodoxin family protein n=1 Tax=unclassified Devosia TaxID=196773 RepID=UPI000868BD93|nr:MULTISPECIES: flavodoxin family protein [unclassified Devosia]ODS86115.1 MAG: NADPH-dependent FMN reductase [Devosia sp. SCN 66-27]OJX27526.1 MAG: NADPH-dependent FMN reductase [Devosia sp. 66-14]